MNRTLMLKAVLLLTLISASAIGQQQTIEPKNSTETLLSRKVEWVDPQSIDVAFALRMELGSSDYRAAYLEKKQLKVGEPLILRFSTKNVTKKPLYLLESNPETDYRLEIKDSNGEAVSLTEYGKHILSNAGQFRLIIVKVQPGEEVQDMMEVNKMFKIDTPGIYYISAKRGIPESEYAALGKQVDISSNTVKAVITPK